MLYNSVGKSMGIGDAEELAAWLIQHMTMEQRKLLMSERPLLYSRTFPSVSHETITTVVSDALTEQNSEYRYGRPDPNSATQTSAQA